LEATKKQIAMKNSNKPRAQQDVEGYKCGRRKCPIHPHLRATDLLRKPDKMVHKSEIYSGKGIQIGDKAYSTAVKRILSKRFRATIMPMKAMILHHVDMHYKTPDERFVSYFQELTGYLPSVIAACAAISHAKDFPSIRLRQ